MGAGFGYWLAPTPEARPRAPRYGVSTAPGTERSAARETRTVPAPTGDGAIRGRVLEEHGAPIANALVVAVPRFPRKGDGRTLFSHALLVGSDGSENFRARFAGHSSQMERPRPPFSSAPPVTKPPVQDRRVR